MTRIQISESLKSKIADIVGLNETQFEEVFKIYNDCYLKFNSASMTDFANTLDKLMIDKSRRILNSLIESELEHISRKSIIYSSNNFFQVKATILMMLNNLEIEISVGMN